MDSIQIYAVLLGLFLVFGFGVAMNQHGQPKVGKEHVGYSIFSIVLFIPIFGRIWGWW
jgi:hypothetical protein